MPDQINFNLGCVVYAETIDGIEAEWVFHRHDHIARGTGTGVRLTKLNPERPFEGGFEITYFDENGNASPKLDLTISFESGSYHLRWRNGGLTTEVGIGIERDNKLLAGYTEVS